MKSKLISLTLVMALLVTSAACVYASNGGTKQNDNNLSVTKVKNEDSDQTAKKERINQKKEQIRSEYTQEEVAAVNDAAETIKKADPKARVLAYDSVISDDAKFKFDTPPVIKEGRTLVPVRAITEGFKAELAYDKESQVVTITKGDIVIELTLGSMVAVVNGTEVEMDTKANIVNSRTYVPLRFVLETFKLGVEWDDETDTIEIDEDTETDTGTEGPATSPEAITITE